MLRENGVVMCLAEVYAPTAFKETNSWEISSAYSQVFPGSLSSGLLISMEIQRWRSDAACGQLPTHLFFPSGNSDVTRADEERAKAVCAGCSVQDQCLAFALDTTSAMASGVA